MEPNAVKRERGWKDVTLKNSKVHAYLQIRQKWIMKMDNADIDNESENTGSDIKNKRFSGKTHNLIYYSDLIFTILLNYQCSPCPHHRIFGSGVSVGARLEDVRIEGGLVEEHSVSLGFIDCVHCFGVGVPCDLVRIVYGDVSWFVEGCSDFVDEDGFSEVQLSLSAHVEGESAYLAIRWSGWVKCGK